MANRQKNSTLTPSTTSPRISLSLALAPSAGRAAPRTGRRRRPGGRTPRGPSGCSPGARSQGRRRGGRGGGAAEGRNVWDGFACHPMATGIRNHWLHFGQSGGHPPTQPATHPPRVRVSKGVPDDPNSCLKKGDLDGYGGLKAKSEGASNPQEASPTLHIDPIGLI